LVFTPALTGVGNIMQTRGPAVALASYMSEASGVPVAAFVPTDYGATLQGLARGRYDIVYLPGPFLVKAQAELGVVPAFAVSANGALTETGLIIVGADSGIADLGDLADKSVGAADLESGTGWVMPAAALKEAGVNALIDLEVHFTGTDPENVVAVLNNELDAAFVSASALEDPAVAEADPDAAEKLTVLAEFPNVPIGGIVFAADVDEADQEALVAALSATEVAEVVDAEGNPALAGLGWDGLVPADEVDFSALAEAASTLGMIKSSE
jgi:phosphonate transport system substrate-binding protein